MSAHNPDYWMYRQVTPRVYPPRLEHEVWRLVKDDRSVSCAVAAHPLGRELIVRVDRELLWSEVYRPDRETELDVQAEIERTAYLSRGWTDV